MQDVLNHILFAFAVSYALATFIALKCHVVVDDEKVTSTQFWIITIGGAAINLAITYAQHFLF